ncbi:MAG TPA: hypothetical protein VGD46_19440, partial [Rhizobacter sp.]
YCHQTKAYGYGWWVKFGTPAQTRVGWGGGYVQDSLHAEIEAIRAGLQWLRTEIAADCKGKRLVVQSDCTGALARIVGDLSSLQRDLLLDQAYSKHVKGHQGHVNARASVNTTCDRHARRMMRQFRKLHLDRQGAPA